MEALLITSDLYGINKGFVCHIAVTLVLLYYYTGL